MTSIILQIKYKEKTWVQAIKFNEIPEKKEKEKQKLQKKTLC